MPIPSPDELKRKNAGKKVAADESKPKLTDEQKAQIDAEQIAKQTAELMEKCETELRDKFKGAALLIGAKYIRKPAIQAVIDEFNATGQWKVTKSYDPELQEVVLKFAAIEGSGEFA